MTAHIHYFTLQDEQRREEKLDWIRETRLRNIPFQRIHPDAKHNWLGQTDNDFGSLLPMVDKEVKAAKSEEALFQQFSLGVVTARDEWVYDEDESKLQSKVAHLITSYNSYVVKLVGKTREYAKSEIDYSIKWTRAVINDLVKGKKYTLDKLVIIDALYRPFNRRKLYFSQNLNEMQYQVPSIFGERGDQSNKTIIFTDASSQKPFMVCSSPIVSDLHFVGAACGSQNLPLYRYDKDGVRHDNITDWGLAQFRERYGSTPLTNHPLTNHPLTNRPLTNRPLSGVEGENITKLDIFHYVYAVLHNPAYRKKYELNLKRDFPRIPLYDDFREWAAWGKTLMELHLNYETAEPYPLERVDLSLDMNGPNHELPLDCPAKSGACHAPLQLFHDPSPTYTKIPKAKLKADKEQGRIIIDEQTVLSGVPASAWEYRLGNRSALEWVLDQYKEKKPTDPTIRKKFNTYRFADYKEQVIDLLRRVCSVSVATMEIVNRMR